MHDGCSPPSSTTSAICELAASSSSPQEPPPAVPKSANLTASTPRPPRSRVARPRAQAPASNVTQHRELPPGQRRSTQRRLLQQQRDGDTLQWDRSTFPRTTPPTLRVATSSRGARARLTLSPPAPSNDQEEAGFDPKPATSSTCTVMVTKEDEEHFITGRRLHYDTTSQRAQPGEHRRSETADPGGGEATRDARCDHFTDTNLGRALRSARGNGSPLDPALAAMRKHHRPVRQRQRRHRRIHQKPQLPSIGPAPPI